MQAQGPKASSPARCQGKLFTSYSVQESRGRLYLTAKAAVPPKAEGLSIPSLVTSKGEVKTLEKYRNWKDSGIQSVRPKSWGVLKVRPCFHD